MKATFIFRKIQSDIFGWIYRSYAEVTFYGKHNRPRIITMVVDTGADYTILPRREAAILGYDLSQDCVAQTTFGVGGPQTVYLLKRTEIELVGTKITIPVGFLDSNDVPPLLGRHQFMELFKTCFSDHRVNFEFEQ